MITKVHLKRFKRFENRSFEIIPSGLSICAGPNSSGKSTLLHALAVWSFGVMVLRQSKGEGALHAGYTGQGAGLSKDDFTPINIPDLKHLWYGLKSQIPGEGYSMCIRVEWGDDKHLAIAFSLVQDRLYVKAESSNLTAGDKIPQIIYLPPVAGLEAREEYATTAKRRAMLGRGLAGMVLRNYLYDLEAGNRRLREEKKAGKKKLSSKDLAKIREIDPWERLNASMREIFGLELKVDPFDPDFHTVIKVDVIPVTQAGPRWKKNGPARDIMVEGAGAQQWLTVFAFALDPQTDVLLLDEPDAHLFTRLKVEMVEKLDAIATSSNGPQILMATHATEILKRHPINRIMSFSRSKPKYLRNEKQRVKLITGMGDEYAPLIEKARASKKILYVENDSDARILKAVAMECGYKWPENLAILESTDSHADRLKLYRVLLTAIDGLKALSIRDRDTQPSESVDCKNLRDKGTNTTGYPDFHARTWRRREIENYALVPAALAKMLGECKAKGFWADLGLAWPTDPEKPEETMLIDCDVKDKLNDFFKKEKFSNTEKFLKALEKKYIHRDLDTIAKQICEL